MYAHAADCLGQLRLLDFRDDAALRARIKDKISDVKRRLENEVMSIRSMLGDDIPRDQDYMCAVEKIHKFSEALVKLTSHLPEEALVQFDEELHDVHKELAALHRVIVENAVQNLAPMSESETKGASTQRTEDPRDLTRSLAKIEFMALHAENKVKL